MNSASYGRKKMFALGRSGAIPACCDQQGNPALVKQRAEATSFRKFIDPFRANLISSAPVEVQAIWPEERTAG